MGIHAPPSTRPSQAGVDDAPNVRSVRRALALQLLALLAAATAAAVGIWLVGERPSDSLIGLAILLPAVSAIAFLLSRQTRTRRAAQQALQSMRARARDFFESAMDPIISIDASQRIVMFNAAAESVFGWPRATVLGQPLEMLIPQRFHGAHRAHVDNFAETGLTTRRMGGFNTLTGLRANGEEFPLEASISQHIEDDRKVLTVILREVTERVRALESLARSKEELREFANAASSAREQEQARIARELHDELAQSMAMLKMDVSLIRSGSAGQDASLAKRLDRMEAQINATIAAMRRIAADLRPLTLDDLGLAAAVESLVQDFERRSGVRCKFAIPDAELDLPARYATAVFRIVQESLTNVSKHARASSVEVTISRSDTVVTVTVRDDGVGFAADGPRKPQSYGLLGVRERAYLLGGQARIASTPGHGTEIEVRLPITSAA